MTNHIEQLVTEVKDATMCPFIDIMYDSQFDGEREAAFAIKESLSRGNTVLYRGYKGARGIKLDMKDLADALSLEEGVRHGVHGTQPFTIKILYISLIRCYR